MTPMASLLLVIMSIPRYSPLNIWVTLIWLFKVTQGQSLLYALEHVCALMWEKRALRNETMCLEKIATCYKHVEQFTEN